MAATTSNRQTRVPTPDSSLVRPAPNASPLISDEAIAAEKQRIRLETISKLELEGEARERRQLVKAAQQEARNRQAKKVDDEAYARKMENFRIEVRNMSEKQRKKMWERTDYYTPEMEDIMKEFMGLPTLSKAVKNTKADVLVGELKLRGILPADFQGPGTTSGSPEQEGSSTSLLEEMTEANAAS